MCGGPGCVRKLFFMAKLLRYCRLVPTNKLASLKSFAAEVAFCRRVCHAQFNKYLAGAWEDWMISRLQFTHDDVNRVL